MIYDPSIHHRRSVRIQGWERYTDGAYFVTICTHKRRCILGDVREERIALSPLGGLVERFLLMISEHAPSAELDCHIIMPNHIHAILVLDSELRRGTACRAPTPPLVEGFAHPAAGSLATVVRSLKGAVTRQAHISCGWEGQFWQRGFYEHIIRDPDDWGHIAAYILSNPSQWTRDHLRPPTDADLAGAAGERGRA